MAFLFLPVQGQESLVSVKKSLLLMGTKFEITVVADNQDLGYIYINEATAEI